MKGSDYATLLRALPALYETRTLPELRQSFLGFLSRFVSSSAIAYNEVNLKTGSIELTMDPPELALSQYVQLLGHFIAEHPLIQYQQRTNDLSARKISDLVSKAQFHNLPIYQEVYRHIGAEDQFALTVRMKRDTIGAIVLNRHRRTFTETERELLNLAQPHLIQAYRNAQTFERVQKPLLALQSLADTLPLGLVLLDRRFHIAFSTERARKLLAAHFPKAKTHRSLPAVLRTWLVNTCTLHGQALPNATSAFSLPTHEGTLSVRCVRKAGCDETILLLEQTARLQSPESLRTLGLTARQAEVLFWVSQGKTNPEIAIILGASTRTIQKHMEHIFSKLGVETRTEAARRALETFNF